MLSYATYFTVNIIFINFDKHSFDTCKLYHHTCLGPKEIKKSISGLRPKKVVHHWSRPYANKLHLALVNL